MTRDFSDTPTIPLYERIDKFFSSPTPRQPVSITVQGHRTSYRLEPVFRSALTEIASREGIATEDLFDIIDQRRGDHALSAALRLFAVAYWRHAVLGPDHFSTAQAHRIGK